MSGKERLQAALEGGAPVPPAAAPLYLSLYLEPHRRKLLAQVYAEMAEGESHLRLTFAEELEAQLEAFARAVALFESPPAWLPVGLGPSYTGAEGVKVTFPSGQCLRHRPGAAEPDDLLAFFDNQQGDVWDDSASLPDPEQIRAQPAPSAQQILEQGRGLSVVRALERFGERFLVHGSVGTPFWHCYERLGFAGMMSAVRERPEVIEALTAADLRRSIPLAEALWETGVRCMFVEECFSSSDLISVEDYLRFAYPPTRDLLAALRGIGFQVVYYFCGGIEGRLEHLAALPANALAFKESKKGFVIDLARIRQEIGPDILLFGNINVLILRDGSAERIAQEVAVQWEAVGPRYVVSIGSPATLDTPPAKLDMLVRASGSATHENGTDTFSARDDPRPRH